MVQSGVTEELQLNLCLHLQMTLLSWTLRPRVGPEGWAKRLHFSSEFVRKIVYLFTMTLIA